MKKSPLVLLSLTLVSVAAFAEAPGNESTAFRSYEEHTRESDCIVLKALAPVAAVLKSEISATGSEFFGQGTYIDVAYTLHKKAIAISDSLKQDILPMLRDSSVKETVGDIAKKITAVNFEGGGNGDFWLDKLAVAVTTYKSQSTLLTNFTKRHCEK